MSSKKKKLMNCILRRANEGCGCAKPKLSDVFQPNPRPLIPIMRGSVAVVKDSEDPYADFRQSMLQMIVERGMESRDELRELLSFYSLNSPSHHQIIVEAFMEIWNDLMLLIGNDSLLVKVMCIGGKR
ncbi:hypothetical protein NMG60_11033435 [Bertholletia excelsa]